MKYLNFYYKDYKDCCEGHSGWVFTIRKPNLRPNLYFILRCVLGDQVTNGQLRHIAV